MITTGASTSLWSDNWILNGSLRAQLIGLLNVREENQLVSQVVSNYGNWHLQLLFDPPENLFKLIQAIPTNINSEVDDPIAWAFTNDDNCSLRTTYNIAKGLNVLNPNTPFLSWIWKLNVPLKFILFIWLCSYNSIPVIEVLGLRGLSLDQLCSVSNSHTKSISHMLKECPFLVSFWNQLDPPSGLYTSFGLLSEWLYVTCKSGLVSQHHGIPWPIMFLFGLWSIWTNRNYVTYQAKQPNQHLWKDCVAKALEFHFLTALSKPSRARARLNAK